MSLALTAIICLVSSFTTLAAEAFKWNWERKGDKLEVSVAIPPGYYLYQDQTQVEVKDFLGTVLPPYSLPNPAIHDDPDAGKIKVFQHGAKNVWMFRVPNSSTYQVAITYQGCKEKTVESPAMCFAPAKERFFAISDGVEKRQSSAVSEQMPENLSKLLSTFKIERAVSGYLSSDEFESFLAAHDMSEESIFSDNSMLAVILLILLGGLGLNLTPCVLPMIPVNLAIIGAGGQSGSKRKGFLLGGTYGAGIALAYGALGIVTVLTGAKFGTLNSQAWFNFAIAAVFFVLALAMFDLFNIDFSRFGAKLDPKGSGKGNLITVFVMGVIAALLAGACVAPVVIAVLLYSAKFYSEGNPLGLLFPLLLGIGMALPWPFAGAGMAVIPKPGAWMMRVKLIFAIMIAAAGIWYAYAGVTLLPSQSSTVVAKEQIPAFEAALRQSVSEDKPLLIDFWASWCKNCTRMESTTFKNPDVQRRLADFIEFKFNAEKMDAKDVKPILDYFKVLGLPTYVIISPPEQK
ncbi:MAG: protein-disulfide reductase DsbD family protein [Victivallaceae bacterium]